MKEKAFISFVIYTYNNQQNIISFLKKLDKYLVAKFENYEIILVNNGSTDKTTDLVKKNKKIFHSQINLINFSWKHDREIAMLAGSELAIGDYIYEIESTNLDYPWEIISQLFKKCTAGYDIVFASPKDKLSFSSKLFYKILNRVSDLNFDLQTDSLKIVTRRALNVILKSKEKIRYRKIQYKYSGLPNTSIFYQPKQKIQSTKDLKEKLTLALEVLLSVSDIGLKISLFFSVISLAISILFGIYTIIVFLTYKSVAAGWTTIMIFLSLGFSGMFLTLGFISKYLMMILIEIKQKPPYTIKSIERLT